MSKKRAPGGVVRQARRYAREQATLLTGGWSISPARVEDLLDAAYRAGYLACLRDRKVRK